MLDATVLSDLSGRVITADQAAAAIAIITAQAKGYTRGEGFTDAGPAEDVEAAIATATLRLLTNPIGVQEESMGAFSVKFGPSFLGWSLSELAVLNRYRERAL